MGCSLGSLKRVRSECLNLSLLHWIACRLTQGNFPAIVACRWFFVEQGFYVLHCLLVRSCTVLIDGVSRRGFVVQWTGGCQIGAHPGDGHLSLSVCYRDDGAADTGFARGVCAP